MLWGVSGGGKEGRMERTVADNCAACHSAEVGDNLGDCDGIGGEVVLIF